MSTIGGALRRTGGVLDASARRLRRHLAMTMLLAASLVAPIAVAVAVPTYSDAASSQLFDQRVGPGEPDDPDAVRSNRLDLLYSFNRLSGGGARTWADVAELDTELLVDHRLPLAAADRFVETSTFTTFVDDERLGPLAFSSVTGFEDDVDVIDGRLPEPAVLGDDVIEVLVEATLATQEGLVVGDELVVGALTDERFDVRVVGTWIDSPAVAAAANGSERSAPTAREPAPFGDADAFRRRLVVPHATITDVISPSTSAAIQNVRWRLVLDDEAFGGDDVAGLLGRIDGLTAAAERLLPGTRELVTPAGALRAFRADEQSLRAGLRSFSTPLIALSIAVGLMVVGIVLRGRLAEFTSLRRRGVSRMSLVVAGVPDAVAISALALAGGLAVGLALAAVMARTDTFFRLGRSDGLDIALGADAWRAATWAAAGVVLLQLVALAVTVSRVAPGGRHERATERPWYQRTNLDLFGVLAVGLVTWRGVTADTGRAALIDDSSVVLLPAAAALAAGLVVLRVVPGVMRGVAALLARTRASASLVAARRAARVPADLAAPLLLLVVTATLATFTASLATTLDRQLADDALHRTGGVARLLDTGQSVPVVSSSADVDGVVVPTPPRSTTSHAALDAYERVWGVTRATATIDIDGTGVHDGGALRGFGFRGVDPVSFAATAFWRSDYADRPLVELMGELAARPDAVLIDRELARVERLAIGDELRLDLLTSAGELQLSVVVRGTFEQFPRWYPDLESPLIVGRADTVETLAGATHDRAVIIEVDDRFGDRRQVESDLDAFGASRPRVADAASAIEAARADPGRRGVLGLLTVGVGLASLLTLVGFVVSTVGSLQRRTTEIGVLRAMGMTRREVSTLGLFDLASVMALGLVAALALGVVFSRWFIPVLVDTPPGAAPELLPAVAWSAIGVLAVALVALLSIAASIVVLLLRRIRLYEAIRLGES